MTPALPELVALSEKHLAVLRRLKKALPTVGLNGWLDGVNAVSWAIKQLQATQPARDSGLGEDARDAARYRWLRRNLLWAKSYDRYVRWSAEIDMPEPGIAESSPPAAESLDAAIDAALAIPSEGEGA